MDVCWGDGKLPQWGCCYLDMNEGQLVVCGIIYQLSVCSCSLSFMSFFLTDGLRSPLPFFISTCSVQKLSEFFSSDEIGDEQEPRAMLTSGSSNHNQNRYQAVVGISACTLFRVCMLSTIWAKIFVCLLYPNYSVLFCYSINVFFFCTSSSSYCGCSLSTLFVFVLSLSCTLLSPVPETVVL